MAQAGHEIQSDKPMQSIPFLGMRPGPRDCVRDERARLAELSFDRIRVTPLAPTIGAEIAGVNLANLDDQTFAEVKKAWLAYKVVFFRTPPLDATAQL
jgi:hypothetical protein